MSLHPKNYADALARKLARPPKPRKPLRSRTSLKRGTKRLKAGKKVKAWESERRKLVKRFLEAGITECELHGVLEHECKFDNWLSFAHAAKRRKLKPEDLSHVILVCTVAHDIIEVWPAEKMKAIVNDTILNRAVQP